jgi:hypothetical protein
MVDRTPSLENEKVYDRDAGHSILLSDLHQLGKALGSRVAEAIYIHVKNHVLSLFHI